MSYYNHPLAFLLDNFQNKFDWRNIYCSWRTCLDIRGLTYTFPKFSFDFLFFGQLMVQNKICFQSFHYFSSPMSSLSCIVASFRFNLNRFFGFRFFAFLVRLWCNSHVFLLLVHIYFVPTYALLSSCIIFWHVCLSGWSQLFLTYCNCFGPLPFLILNYCNCFGLLLFLVLSYCNRCGQLPFLSLLVRTYCICLVNFFTGINFSSFLIQHYTLDTPAQLFWLHCKFIDTFDLRLLLIYLFALYDC